MNLRRLAIAEVGGFEVELSEMIAFGEEGEAAGLEGVNVRDVGFGRNLETGEVVSGIDENAAEAFVGEVAGRAHGGAEGGAFLAFGSFVFLQPNSGLGNLAFDVGGFGDEGFGDDAVNENGGVVLGDALHAVDVTFGKDIGDAIEDGMLGVFVVNSTSAALGSVTTVVTGPAFAKDVGPEASPVDAAEFASGAECVCGGAESEDGLSGLQVVGDGSKLILGEVAKP